MKKNKIIILLYLALALTFGACENVDFGDMNENKNGPTEPDPQTLLTAAQVNYATITGREYLIRPTLYVQYQTQNVYTDEMRYNEAASYWGQYYASELNALQEVINFLDNPDNITPTILSKGAVENQKGVAMIMKAVIIKRLTDTFGNVPYSEALQGLDNLTPAYDSQESIYKSIIDEVKAARDMMDESLAGPVGDIIYKGNVVRWKKFANSFILQASLQLSKKYPGSSDYAATEFNGALNDPNGVIENISDEAWFTFYNTSPGQNNPWSRNRAKDYNLSKEFTDALNGYTGASSLNPTSNHTLDIRLKVYSSDSLGDGRPYGYDALQTGDAQMDKVHWWNVNASLPLMTASYTYLNRADAANLGWTTEDPATMLTNGIVASYNSLNINKVIPALNAGKEPDVADANELPNYAPNYAAARVADASTTSFAQVIAEEKWVSLFPQGFDAWAEWRRTNFPTLQPAHDYLNDGNIPRRYIYPSDESGLNGENYKSGVNALVPPTDSNTSKVWWDQ